MAASSNFALCVRVGFNLISEAHDETFCQVHPRIISTVMRQERENRCLDFPICDELFDERPDYLSCEGNFINLGRRRVNEKRKVQFSSSLLREISAKFWRLEMGKINHGKREMRDEV